MISDLWRRAALGANSVGYRSIYAWFSIVSTPSTNQREHIQEALFGSFGGSSPSHSHIPPSFGIASELSQPCGSSGPCLLAGCVCRVLWHHVLCVFRAGISSALDHRTTQRAPSCLLLRSGSCHTHPVHRSHQRWPHQPGCHVRLPDWLPDVPVSCVLLHLCSVLGSSSWSRCAVWGHAKQYERQSWPEHGKRCQNIIRGPVKGRLFHINEIVDNKCIWITILTVICKVHVYICF